METCVHTVTHSQLTALFGDCVGAAEECAREGASAGEVASWYVSALADCEGVDWVSVVAAEFSCWPACGAEFVCRAGINRGVIEQLVDSVYVWALWAEESGEGEGENDEDLCTRNSVAVRVG